MAPLFPPNDDLRALLRACKAAPDDAAPRLIVADYLDEIDQPERAALFRLGCQLDELTHAKRDTWNVEREIRNLCGRFGDVWFAPWRRVIRYEHKRYRGGLLDMTLNATGFLATFHNDPESVAHFAWVERFTVTDLSSAQVEPVLHALLQIRDITALTLHSPFVSSQRTPQVSDWRRWRLHDMPYLRELALGDGMLDPSGLLASLRAGYLARLQKLALPVRQVDDDLAAALCDPTTTPVLRELWLSLHDDQETVAALLDRFVASDHEYGTRCFRVKA